MFFPKNGRGKEPEEGAQKCYQNAEWRHIKLIIGIGFLSVSDSKYHQIFNPALILPSNSTYPRSPHRPNGLCKKTEQIIKIEVSLGRWLWTSSNIWSSSDLGSKFDVSPYKGQDWLALRNETDYRNKLFLIRWFQIYHQGFDPTHNLAQNLTFPSSPMSVQIGWGEKVE